jgi:hypothetical protein
MASGIKCQGLGVCLRIALFLWTANLSIPTSFTFNSRMLHPSIFAQDPGVNDCFRRGRCDGWRNIAIALIDPPDQSTRPQPDGRRLSSVYFWSGRTHSATAFRVEK